MSTTAPSLAERVKIAAKALAGVFSGSIYSETEGQFLHMTLPRFSSGNRDAKALLDLYLENPLFSMVVDKVSTSLAAQPLELLQSPNGAASKARSLPVEKRMKFVSQAKSEGNLVPVQDDPLAKFLQRGNGILSGREVTQLTFVYWDVAGEAWWLLERNRLGQPLAPVPVAPHWVQEMPTVQKPFYTVQIPSGSRLEVEPEDVFCMKRANPNDPYGRGRGRGSALQDELETEEYAAKFQKHLFLNDATPRLLIAGEGLDTSTAKDLETTWRAKLRGYKRAGTPFFLGSGGGKLTVQTLTQSLSDLQIVELQRYLRDFTIHFYGVPPEIFGIVENSNRATIQAADFLFAKHVLVPRLELLTEALQWRLLPQFGKDPEKYLVSYESPIEADEERELAAAKAAPWALEVNEWRALAGQDAKPELEDIHLVPLTLVQAATRRLGELPPMAEPAETSIADIPLRRALPAHTRQPIADAGYFTELLRIAESRRPALVRAFQRAVEAMRAGVDHAALARAADARDPRGAVEAITVVSLAAAFAAAFAQEMGRAALAAAEKAIAQLVELLGAEIDEEALSIAAIDWASAHGDMMPTRLTNAQETDLGSALGVVARDETLDLSFWALSFLGLSGPQMTALLNRGRDLLEAGEDLAAGVDRYAKELLRHRAETIAKTELDRAVNEGQRQTWKQAQDVGVLPPGEYQRQWVTILDGKADDDCEVLHGSRAPLVGGEYPNGAAGPPLHVNCRCSERMVSKDDPGPEGGPLTIS